MSKIDTPTIIVAVHPQYLPEESTPSEQEFVFRYAITLNNTSNQGAKLLTRHWLIKDMNDQSQEVSGQGVMGKQPHIKAGDTFNYSSFVVIETELGTMQGSYQFIDDNQQTFTVNIPPFMLANPKKLH
jgi:ApaG protein